MGRLALKTKQKRLNLRPNVQQESINLDVYSKAIMELEEKNEINALNELLITFTKVNENVKLTTNKWYSFKENHLPPYTNNEIVIYNSDLLTKSIMVSFVFLQHYLMDKYYYGFKERPAFFKITHFMLLSDPK